MLKLLPIAILLLSGCPVGTFGLEGFRPVTDDATADDDDAGADDDDSAGDDDDATPVGGPVFCGTTPTPINGTATSAFTGEAEWVFDFDHDDLLFGVDWDGCEAQHFWDVANEIECGMRWEATGEAYVSQFQSTGLVVRFQIEMELDENTCRSNHPDARDRTAFFRATIPYTGDTITLQRGEGPNDAPNTLQDWASIPYEPQGEEPDEIVLDYATAFGTTL